MRTNAHILIDQSLMPGLPPLDLHLDLLESRELRIENKEHEIALYASFEWAVPSIIFAYITRPYFEGFLNEMGSSHYKALKDWIFKQNKRFKSKSTQTITATRSTEKKTNSNSPSNFFTIYTSTPKGNILKIFMPGCESEESDMKALSSLLDDIRELYIKPEGEFTIKINGLTDNEYEGLYATFNNKLGVWEFYNDSMLIEISKKQNT